MSPEEFEYAAHFLKERSGLVLTRDKTYLLENRLMPLVRDRRLKAVSELIAAMKAGDPALQEAVIDAMMAKDTAFFRDWKPFLHFRNVVLPNLRVSRGRKSGFRILSAGASTGQEAYSIAMTIRDLAASFPDWQIEVVGIDISATAVAAAANGNFSQFDIQRGLPIRTLLQYFSKKDDAWVLNDDVRAMAKFQKWNLLDELYPLGRFDAIFCRNVLIYLDLKAKLEVLQKVGRLMADDGVLYTGLGESLTGMSSNFRAVDPNLGIYAAHRAERPATLSLATKINL